MALSKLSFIAHIKYRPQGGKRSEGSISKFMRAFQKTVSTLLIWPPFYIFSTLAHTLRQPSQTSYAIMLYAYRGMNLYKEFWKIGKSKPGPFGLCIYQKCSMYLMKCRCSRHPLTLGNLVEDLVKLGILTQGAFTMAD